MKSTFSLSLNKQFTYIQEIVEFFTDLQHFDTQLTKSNPNLIVNFENFLEQLNQFISISYDYKNDHTKISIAIIGDFNAGKSSFVNSLLGQETCPVKANPTTSSITRFVWGSSLKYYSYDSINQNKSLISFEEYKDKVTNPDIYKDHPTFSFVVEYPLDILSDVELIDTPGFNNSQNQHDTEITKENTRTADIILYLLDINKGEISADSLEILKEIKSQNDKKLSTHHKWFLVLNKADLKSPNARKKIVDKLANKYQKDKLHPNDSNALFDDIFCYSSEDSLNESKEDNDWKKAMSQLIENAKSDEKYEISVHEAQDDKLYLNLQDRSFLINHQYSEETLSISQMKNKFKQIIATKDEIIQSDYEVVKREIASQQDMIQETLNLIRDEKERIKNQKSQEEQIDINKENRYKAIEKEIDETFQNWLKIIEMELIGTLQISSIKKRDLLQTERSFWSTPYAGFVINQGEIGNLVNLQKLTSLSNLIKISFESENLKSYNQVIFDDTFIKFEKQFLSGEWFKDFLDNSYECINKVYILAVYEELKDIKSVDYDVCVYYLKTKMLAYLLKYMKTIIHIKSTYINRYLGVQINKDDQSSKLLDKLETKLVALQTYHKLNFPS